ncbi:hypothetical protein AB205_0205880, partial [Aquarana catesbeiana]
ALQPGALQPLPKRPALEKSNGATTMFNPSVFHYQQALANMQLQQTAFIPTVDHVEILNSRIVEYQNLTMGSYTWPFCKYPLLAASTTSTVSLLQSTC